MRQLFLFFFLICVVFSSEAQTTYFSKGERTGMLKQQNQAPTIQRYRDADGYFIEVRNLGGPFKYGISVYRLITIGKRKDINSFFASQFLSVGEVSYKWNYDFQKIEKTTFWFSSSLTGFADPDNAEYSPLLDWHVQLPDKSCPMPISASLVADQEYLEASCLKNEQSAIIFAQKFLKYVKGRRGL